MSNKRSNDIRANPLTRVVRHVIVSLEFKDLFQAFTISCTAFTMELAPIPYLSIRTYRATDKATSAIKIDSWILKVLG